MIGRYATVIEALTETGTGQLTCHGNSMLPILSNPSKCLYEKADEYEIGDIVLCKVYGRMIDAHFIVKKDSDKYLIANNRGFENGWTKTIYGRVTDAYDKHGNLQYRRVRHG